MVDILSQLEGLFQKPAAPATGMEALEMTQTADARKSKGERNANEGNIEDGKFARSQPGYIGSDGRFAKFDTPENGRKAQETLLRKRYGGLTPAQVVQKYAPLSKENPENVVRNYIGYISTVAGVDPDKPIPAEKFAKFAQGMREFETGKRSIKGFKPYAGALRGKGAASQAASGGYSGSPGIGVADPSEFLAGLESSLGPEAMASQNVTQNSTEIFGADAELKRRANKVEADLQNQGQLIGVLDQAMEVAQSGAREAMTRQIDDTRTVSNEIVEGQKSLKEKVIPLFKARGQIADQLDQINAMNPLERGIRGIFDTNYDQDYLEGQLDRYDRTLKMRADDFNYLNNLHEVGLKEIERRYALDTGMTGLLEEQAKADLGVAGLRLTQSAGMLGNLRDKVNMEVQMIGAKATARQDLLGRLDIPTVTGLMNEAQKAGGIVRYNGVEFSYKELRTQVEESEKQELAVESIRMSIAANRMDMTTKYSENLARSLSRGQLEAAINNGGVYKGIQLPQDLLTNLYQSMITRGETQAAVAMTEATAGSALDIGVSHSNYMIGLSQRAREVIGKEGVDAGDSYMLAASDTLQKLTKAIETNQPPEVISALSVKMQQEAKAFSDVIDAKVLEKVGGDKRAAGYLKGFMTGQPLSAGTAAEAMTYFAVKGNLPSGIATSKEAQAVFKQAQKLAVKLAKDPATGKPRSEASLIAAVQGELTKVAAVTMGQARHDQLYGDIPRIAKAAGHEFGKFDRGRWAEIRSESAMTAAESIASTVNTTPQNVIKMYTSGKALSDSEEDKQLWAEVKKLAPEYNAVDSQTTVRLLDLEPRIKAGYRNSSVLTEFMGTPQFSTGITDYKKGTEHSSMGDYLVGPLTEGVTESNFAKTRDDLLTGQSSVWAANRQLAQNPATNLVLRPVTRTGMILKAIPGVGVEGEKLLRPFLATILADVAKEDAFSGSSFGLETPNAKFTRQDAIVYEALAAQKFENPTLEIYRKNAVRGWESHATIQKGFVERLIEAALDAPDAEVIDAEAEYAARAK